MIKVDKLLEEVGTLPIEIKTQLIEKLLESINPSQKEIDELWAIEAEKRIKEIKDGSVKPIHGNDIFSHIQNKFSK